MVFLRILSTVNHVDSWYQDNPFEKGSKANKSLSRVRRACHLQVSKLMNEKYPLKDDLWLSQFDMTMTQWSLIGPVAIRPKQCGFYSTTREEFEEYIYFWRVIGYCMGIEDRFNCCLTNYEESVQFMEICFDRGYKPYLDQPNSVVQAAMRLTEGVFLGLNISVPKFIMSYEGFMKYWYETLNVTHSISLDSLSARISYKLQVFLVDYLLKWTIFYRLASALYFRMLKKLFVTVNQVKSRMDEKYKDIVYRIPSENGVYSINNQLYTPNIPQLANVGIAAT
uniref:Uncharacterized protein n=2 Tax=Tetranychus urticae TaxID=32264 RepID=T1KTV6_TETUR